MVVEKDDVKPDVFAPFQLCQSQEDSEPKLVEQERQQEDDGTSAGSQRDTPNGDIFARFKLSDILWQSEEAKRERKEADGNKDDMTSPKWRKPPLLRRILKRHWNKPNEHSTSRPGKNEVTNEKGDDDEAEADVGTEPRLKEGKRQSANNLLGSSMYWESPGDDIFADFNLSAIVRDYETLQRKVKYAPTRDAPDDSDSDDEGNPIRSINVRYKNLKQWWLDTWPRTHGIIFRILIPFLVIQVIAIGIGHLLAAFEKEGEYDRNDEVIANRFIMEQFPKNESMQFLFGMPTVCFRFYIASKGAMDVNLTTPADPWLEQSLSDWVGTSFPAVSLGFSDDNEQTMMEIERFMEVCEEAVTKVTTRLLDYTTESAAVMYLYSSLTFDWIRCWNISLYGEPNPFRANPGQLEAAGRQDLFYEESWKRDQAGLYDQYLLVANCTTFECRKLAFDRSVENATGRDMCRLNNGASAWFFFTVMTTVGYGNQAPVTYQGRALVACLGWMSIVVWGMLLYVAGQVMSIITNDFFRKCHLRFMTRDMVAALFWGVLAIVWMMIMAFLSLSWWRGKISLEETIENFLVAFWWAYVSILTVGLGDYHLEPEYIFFSDLIIWAFVFLVGFMFLSTFLNQMSDLCKGFFPDSGEALKERLRNTNLVGLGAVHYKEKNEKALENIGQIVEKMDADSVGEMMHRVTRIRQKKELLIRLLYQTQEELDYFTKRGESYEEPPLSRVAEEENMLSEVLEDTSREREKIERYSNKVIIKDEEVPMVATGEGRFKKEGNAYGKKGKLPFLTTVIFLFLAKLLLLVTVSATSSSGFPGTIPANRITPLSAQNDVSAQNGNIESKGGDSDTESSSEWDEALMESYKDDPALFLDPSPPQQETLIQVLQQNGRPNPTRSSISSALAKQTMPLESDKHSYPEPSREKSTEEGHTSQRPTSKPLKTLEKLQQLLDETDYMTTASSAMAAYQDESGSDEEQGPALSFSAGSASPSRSINPLWTSQDRSKYRKQQLMQEQFQRQQASQQQLSDIEDNSDTDDGLGYTLPNLPVYLSDDEGGESTGPASMSSSFQSHNPLQSVTPQYPPTTSSQQQQQNAANLAHQHFLQQQRELYLAQQYYQQLQQQQPHPAYNSNAPHYPPPILQYPPPYNQYYPTPHTHLPQQQVSAPGLFPRVLPQPPNANYFFQPYPAVPQLAPTTVTKHANMVSNHGAWQEQGDLVVQASCANMQPHQPEYLQKIQHVGSRPPLAFSVLQSMISAQRIGVCSCIIALLCYAAVSPRTLHYLDYNRHFYENLRRAALVVIPPLIVYSWGVVDWTGGVGKPGANHEARSTSLFSDFNPIHNLICAMTRSFTFGYAVIFVLEIALTTLLRLAVFAWWEPEMFTTPKPPFADTFSTAAQHDGGVAGGLSVQVPPPAWLILPWVLREHRFRVKRITLLVADFVTSCVMSPIVEEYFKLRLLQWNMKLAKNFNWVRKRSKKHRRKWVAEPITADGIENWMTSADQNGQQNGLVTNVNPYVAGMLAVTLGLKWADAIRRVCMYTKASDEHKDLYALLRGLFPVQELCGCMTALRLARRDILGQKMPLWSILLPAMIVHGMANFRGMKPIFKWNSATPWSEMQLSRGTFSSDALSAIGGVSSQTSSGPIAASGVKAFAAWLGQEFPRITWLIILFRVAGYCIKNYYMINRHAHKRMTTYAGKHAAFSAELETAEKLKQSAKEKKQ